jgi:hypothetical protein
VVKKFLGNEWFLAVAGAAVMAAFAWFDTPLRMVVLGLPFYLIVVVPLMIARYLPAVGRQPVTFGSNRPLAVISWVLTLIALGYVFWGRATNSGLVGWLDAVQARGHGSYSLKLSVAVACVYMVVVVGALIWVASRLLPGRPAAPGVPVAAKPKVDPRQVKALQMRIVMLVFLGIAVGIWPIGFGVYEYYADQNRREMQATYQPVDPSASTLGQPAYVSLRARVHRAGYVVRHSGNSQDGTLFVPLMTPPGKDLAAPVHWVLQMDGTTLPTLPRSVLGHALGGTVPLTTRQTFDQMGVRLADDAVLVSYVPTDDTGAVIDRSASYWQFFLIGSTVLSVITVVMGGMIWVVQLPGSRKAARVARRSSPV